MSDPCSRGLGRIARWIRSLLGYLHGHVRGSRRLERGRPAVVVDAHQTVPFDAVGSPIERQGVALAREKSVHLHLGGVWMEPAEVGHHLWMVQRRGHGGNGRRVAIDSALVVALLEPKDDQRNRCKNQQSLKNSANCWDDSQLWSAYILRIAKSRKAKKFSGERRQGPNTHIEDGDA